MEINFFDNVCLKDVETVFIDLDNTLYEYEPSHQSAIEACFREYQKNLPQVTFEHFEMQYRNSRTEVTKRLSPQGACRSRLLAFMHMFEREKSKDAYSKAERFDDIYWNNFYSSMVISSKALQFLKKCNKNSITVCIVTDMLTNIQIRKINALKIGHLISAIVTSEEAGAEKPSVRIFQAALDKTKGKKEKSIFIGDDLEKDYKGAVSFGLKAYWIKAHD